MNIQVRKSRVGIKKPGHTKHFSVLLRALFILFLYWPASLVAQTQEQPQLQAPASSLESTEEVADTVVFLPDSDQMALALATPGLRNKALLDLASAANVLSRVDGVLAAAGHDALAQHFLADRAWLQLLVERYGWTRPRSSVLDPAAWLVLKVLQQYDLEEMALVFPGRTPENVLIYQVFQRSGERLAAASLPFLLLQIEADAVTTWNAFLQLTGAEGVPDSAWKKVETAWFADEGVLIPGGLDDDGPAREPLAGNILPAMSQLVLSTVAAGPPDSTGLQQLRYSLLREMPELSGVESARARDALYLSSIIDGLHDGRYFEFIQGLLSITSRLLEDTAQAGETLPLVNWLVTELPAISAHYAVGFASVDPRLNAVMAASHEVLLTMVKSDGKQPGIRASRSVLADAVAQLALLIPDMAYYFATPVRATIVEEINTCISIAAGLADDGTSSMTRSQFDACMETLLQLADRETRLAELAGDMNGPFTIDTLRRELSVTPWQRINYGIGYLHERYSTDCRPPASALPNPLEWAVLATTMSWFAEHSPGFLYTPENETRFAKMQGIGEQLILGLAEQTACLAGTGASVNDPVSRGMADYELALRELDAGIENAEVDFRTEQLSPGADVSLDQDASQMTSYRPDELLIAPCDERLVCEMNGSLSTTRALIGLFPAEYLLAEQTGMGHIEICYRNMEWVQRRSELVRPDDENVANYFGHLGFDLVGRYEEKGQASDIFGFRFTSPQEYHYLFAQTSEEVLDDSCPVEWVGSRVITPLREKRGGIVPNRLTYLAASRKLPSRLLQNNWDRGAEWRDWFVTGIGVSALEVSRSPEIMNRLNQHLQNLYQAQQLEIYQRVLLPNARNSQGDDVSLFDEMSQVSIAKAMIRMQLTLFYPESLFNSDSIRMAIAGDEGLLERRSLHRFREDNVALTSVNMIASERLENLRKVWLKQTEATRRQGSVPASLAHALTRINILYRQFFIPRPEPLQEVEVTTTPQD
jgi:hypothetical protein